ncbi:hypothetical protein SAMN05660337_2626 [Maridesulfovibrio ferrireducens]|uniref:Uncharacterized protein n=1 Tax=Maridesulfovibrio ferrireducens TaxID=246191 RepID=A0A1G9J391_9BACT|nr:hypothetical protein [Maridesulfovibrio ferrireducens]SDL31960.1 hypothetical protein SAMN05660337_2626 [Maridesulfovibrio ferrireducens]
MYNYLIPFAVGFVSLIAVYVLSLPRNCRYWMLPLVYLLFGITILFYALPRVVPGALENIERSFGDTPGGVEIFLLYLNAGVVALLAVVMGFIHMGIFICGKIKTFSGLSFLSRVFRRVCKNELFLDDYSLQKVKKMPLGYKKGIQGNILMNPEFKILGLFLTTLALFFIVASLVAHKVAPHGLFESTVLKYPVFLTLTFFITGLYFSGESKESRTSFTHESSSGKLTGKCGEFFDSIGAVFWRSILYSSGVNESRVRIVADQSSMVTDRRLASIIRSISGYFPRGFNEMHRKLLEALWDGKDLLVVSGMYDEVAPILFTGVQHDIQRLNKIVVFTSSLQGSIQRQEEEAWLTRWLEDGSLYSKNAIAMVGFDDFTGQEDVLISCPNELLLKRLDTVRDWIEQVSKIIVLNLDESVFSNILPAASVLRIIRDIRGDDLQMIFLTDDYDASIKVVARAYLGGHPEKFTFRGKRPESYCYRFFDLNDSSNYLRVLGGVCDYVSPENGLAAYMLSSAIPSVEMQGFNKTAWSEFVSRMDDVESGDLNRGSYSSRVAIATRPMLRAIGDAAIIVARDDSYNLPLTLSKTLEGANKYMMANVFSPRYMLRDYFLEYIDFFMENPLQKFAPLLSRDKTGVALLVYERLRVEEMDEKSIRQFVDSFFHTDELAGATVDDNLRSVFNYAYNKKSDISSYFTIRDEMVFDDDLNDFVSSAKYKIPHEMSKDWAMAHREIFNFNDASGRTIKKVFGHQIVQNYLPGQVHCYNGEAYKISSINKAGKFVNVEYVLPDDERSYRHKVIIECHGCNEVLACENDGKSFGHFYFNSTIEDCFYSIKTEGYFQFSDGVNLGVNKFKYIPMHDTLKRTMNHGRRLRWEISSEASHPLDADSKISFTFAILLKEILQSMFPDLHQYLHVIPVRPPEIGGDPIAEKLQLATRISALPHFEESLEHGGDGRIGIEIFEDSIVDMGLCRAIEAGKDHIFEVLEDYLFWYESLEDKSESFLWYGQEKEPEVLRLKELRSIISTLIETRHQTIRKRREAFLERSVASEGGNYECDFCGCPISPELLWKSDDGRVCCGNCERSARIKNKDDYRKKLEEISCWMCSKFGLDGIIDSCHVHIVDPLTLSKCVGTLYNPCSKLTPRSLGAAVRYKDGSVRIYIENSMPEYLALSTLVHELTHVWQYDKFGSDLDGIPLRLVEGHAIWMEINYLEEKKLGPFYAQRVASAKDLYGIGYREIVKELKDKYDDPFQLMRDLVIKG